MNLENLTIEEQRKALELFDLIIDGKAKYSRSMTDEQVEEIFREMQKL